MVQTGTLSLSGHSRLLFVKLDVIFADPEPELLLPEPCHHVAPVVFVVVLLERVDLLDESLDAQLLLLTHLVDLVVVLPEYLVLEVWIGRGVQMAVRSWGLRWSSGFLCAASVNSERRLTKFILIYLRIFR